MFVPQFLPLNHSCLNLDHAQLIARLTDQGPAVRRVAIMDALRVEDPSSRDMLLKTLLARLESNAERDDKCRLLVIRGLGTAAYAPARETLARLRDDTRTSPAEYHAALVAHDAIEVALRPPPVVVTDDADGVESES